MMLFRLLLVALFVTAGSAHSSASPEWIEYSPEAFSQAQQSGDAILVDVHATWCPTCRIQAPILDELRNESAMSGVTFIKVDFDRETEFLEANRIPRQSTILIWQGEREIARSIAETDRDRLREFVFKAIAEVSE
ncbi:MAG: thioredoxin family protein [Rhodospirillaceae bacterium]|nr:thioredoxin family protein [Rhodospirillaceae bacterium]